MVYRLLRKNCLFGYIKGKFSILEYSRVEANPPHPYIKVEEAAHEAVVNYREPTQPNPVRSARPKGKECRHKMRNMYRKRV